MHGSLFALFPHYLVQQQRVLFFVQQQRVLFSIAHFKSLADSVCRGRGVDMVNTRFWYLKWIGWSHQDQRVCGFVWNCRQLCSQPVAPSEIRMLIIHNKEAPVILVDPIVLNFLRKGNAILGWNSKTRWRSSALSASNLSDCSPWPVNFAMPSTLPTQMS